MRITSVVPKAEYLEAMKSEMGSFAAFGSDRLVGTVIGPFFSVTYCSGAELNRKITNEKNRAIGYVRAVPEGTQVRCVRLAGLTNPASLAILFVVYFIMVLVVQFNRGMMLGLQFSALCAVIGAVVTGIYTAITDSLTEHGQEGYRVVTAFLHDPRDFYGNIYKY